MRLALACGVASGSVAVVALLGAALAACGSSSSGDSAGQHAGEGGAGGSTAPESTSGCKANTIKNGTFDLTFKNVKYQYLVHLPPSYDGSKPTPLVLNWHGLTSNATQQESFSNMDPEADAKGFVLVYPNSPDMSWNAGTCCAFNATNRDDVGFAIALVQQIESVACIDAKRIYTTGMSNGAFMSYALGCEHAETFAAIAPVAGKVGVTNCNPSRSVPLMAFHGTADPLVAYDAGTLSADNQTVPETVATWASHDGCTEGPKQTYQKGTVTCQEWSGCDGGAMVTLCSAAGEGHCWPGQTVCPYGASTTDINATTEIGDFFSKFALP
jgi:polyhydroxybutyrate depolymerase